MRHLDARVIAQLAARGRAVCQGRCGAEKPLAEVMNLRLGDQVVFAMCRACFGEQDLVIRRTPQGLSVTAENRTSVVIASRVPEQLAAAARAARAARAPRAASIG